ncbi:MAG: hypothetical protein EZS28_022232 [Streblomastix strix]|uniref:Uncharacterized protein n=1 Tax=Streblomastix strix TaxID=222440 RepID=A0A5J4VI15_9EUKA|nr:MAG: hypothetical protein EZS28_022232 [Streblomastix strix]
MMELIDAQQALLLALENGLFGKDNIEQKAHAFAILYARANSVAQLSEHANATWELRDEVGGNILHADLFSDDSTESIKMYLELKKVDQLHFPDKYGGFRGISSIRSRNRNDYGILTGCSSHSSSQGCSKRHMGRSNSGMEEERRWDEDSRKEYLENDTEELSVLISCNQEDSE